MTADGGARGDGKLRNFRGVVCELKAACVQAIRDGQPRHLTPNSTGAPHFAAHSRVRHSTGEYVVGDAYTNTVEGFFGNLKTGIRGNYKKVSHKWLQGYLNEFTWRYNHRYSERQMFQLLLLKAATSSGSRE